jgi:hypothetical protein
MTQADRDALYAQFLREENAGLKHAAKATLRTFLDTFVTDEDRRIWTQAHLPDLPLNRHGRIRHEIYEEVIFPVLATGHEAGDPLSTCWLAKTFQNLCTADHLYARIDYMPQDQMLKAAYARAPDNRHVREALLESLLADFAFLDHEWPTGILLPQRSGEQDWAALDRDIALARSLDDHGTHRERLDQFARRVAQDRARPEHHDPG